MIKVWRPILIPRAIALDTEAYSLEVNENVFGRGLPAGEAVSSLRHLVVNIVEADGGACRLKDTPRKPPTEIRLFEA